MRRLGRLLAAAGLVVAGGLALPGGAARAAACSGTTGVTVVIDYGSTSSTLCGPDASSAIKVLTSVVSPVTYPPQYPGTVICQIKNVPSQPCNRMPPQSAYWAFFHASRGGAWVYSSSGVAEYDPPAGSVIGFAFGAGGAPSSAPPAAAPKPAPKPTPSSTSSTPRSTGTSSSPRPPSSSRPSTRTTVLPNGSTATVPATPRTTTPASSRSTTTPTGSATSATSPTSAEPTPTTGAGEETAASAATQPAGGSGTPTTLLAGVGLVTLVGAAAAYLALRRRGENS